MHMLGETALGDRVVWGGWVRWNFRPICTGEYPAGGSMLERQQMTPEEKRRRASEKTILIVEDNELNMKLFHDLIQAHGYNILQTKDGMEALKLARQHKPDLILMDIQLPEVSGLEV